MKQLPIGVSDFKFLIGQDYYYIDKTLFIKEIIETSSQVLLIPRPRRFGKTLNLSMLKYFFEKTEPETSYLFKNTNTLPVIIYIHGAGWVFGNQSTHDRLVREICHGTEAAVVFVDYTLAPEGQYPRAHEDGYAAAKWISENGKSLNLDISRMVIAGDSVGGLMATAIAMMSKDRGGPEFIFQLLLYPVTDARFDTESYLAFEKRYFLETEAMKWFWNNYVPDPSIRVEPYVSPLRASIEQLQGMPPALIITNEIDVLRDEGEAYAHKLMQAGVPVTGVRYLGLTHDSAMLNAITQAPGVRAMIRQVNQTLQELFSKNK